MILPENRLPSPIKSRTCFSGSCAGHGLVKSAELSHVRAAGLTGGGFQTAIAPGPAGGSSNGRTPDSDSGYLGSNPSPPANQCGLCAVISTFARTADIPAG